MIHNLRELYQYRALLGSLVQRELKARYRGSILGFFWTFLNPTLLMAVYALVFSVFMKNSIPNYAYFIFVGLLPWIFFASTVGSGASAISDRRDLLTKVRFPAQVLPATVVMTNGANYVLSLPLMLGLGFFLGVDQTWHVVLFPLVLAVQVLFTLGITYVISAMNVGFRDLQHIVTNVITLWFFVTPIVYSSQTVRDRLGEVGILGNPMAVLVTSYQAIFYEHRLPDFRALGMVMGMSVVLLWFSARVFEHKREEFAELV
jgi:lipopolysaccharide transport system permease protein